MSHIEKAVGIVFDGINRSYGDPFDQTALWIVDHLVEAGLIPSTVTTVDEVDALDPKALLMTERDELWKAGSIPAIMLPATLIWQPGVKA